MRRSIALVGLSGALMAGSAALVLTTPTLSGAQASAGTSVAHGDGADTSAHETVGHRAHRGMAGGLDAVATALGTTADELRAALRDGKTLGALADEAGVSRSALVDTMMQRPTQHLEQKVADGELTREQADERLARIEARLTERLDRTMPAGRGGAPGHRGPHGA